MDNELRTNDEQELDATGENVPLAGEELDEPNDGDNAQVVAEPEAAQEAIQEPPAAE